MAATLEPVLDYGIADSGPDLRDHRCSEIRGGSFCGNLARCGIAYSRSRSRRIPRAESVRAGHPRFRGRSARCLRALRSGRPRPFLAANGELRSARVRRQSLPRRCRCDESLRLERGPAAAIIESSLRPGWATKETVRRFRDKSALWLCSICAIPCRSAPQSGCPSRRAGSPCACRNGA